MTSFKSQTKILECTFISIHNFNIGSSDKEQLMYTETRLEDLQSMTASNTPNMTWAAFLGTAPHTYHKRGAVEKNAKGETNPFQKLRQEEIAVELENHNIWTDKETKSELSNLLTQKLQCICRPPALMCKDPLKSAKDINVNKYEVLSCEPLHVITNIVQTSLQSPHFMYQRKFKRNSKYFQAKQLQTKINLKGQMLDCLQWSLPSSSRQITMLARLNKSFCP